MYSKHNSLIFGKTCGFLFSCKCMHMKGSDFKALSSQDYNYSGLDGHSESQESMITAFLLVMGATFSLHLSQRNDHLQFNLCVKHAAAGNFLHAL